MHVCTFNLDTVGLVLSNLKAFFGSLGGVDEKILDPFVVDFHHGNLDLVGLVRVGIGRDTAEDFLASQGHDTTVGTVTDHRVRFARSCLTVGKQATMEAFPCTV